MGLFNKKDKKEEKDLDKKEIKKSVKVEKKVKEVKKTDKKVEKKAKKEYQDTNIAYKTLIKPIISEKATIGVANGKYVFEVYKKANKVQIKKAVKEIYGKEPVKVNVLNKMGKKVTFGRTRGRQKDVRKAVITLKKGETINLYEGI